MILSYVINIILPSNFVIANDIAYHNGDTFKLLLNHDSKRCNIFLLKGRPKLFKVVKLF